MRIRPLVAAAVVAALAVAPAADAAKKRKPLKGGYDLTLPVPFPGESSNGSHCQDAPAGVSKDARPLALPAAGKLKITLSGHVGDWVIEVFDAKGRRLTSSGGLVTPGDAITLTHRKKTRTSEKLTVMVCNYTGGPYGRVDWLYTFD